MEYKEAKEAIKEEVRLRQQRDAELLDKIDRVERLVDALQVAMQQMARDLQDLKRREK
jgi:hypothetical protein